MAEQLDLSEMLHTVGMCLPFDVDVPVTPELELDCQAPVTGRLVFTNCGNVLVIQGQVSTELRTQCSRCLADVVTVIEAPVEEAFNVEDCTITGRADDEFGMAEPSTAALWQEGYLLNLTELIRQSIVLAAPGEPLCREDCKGLCPYCGGNRNENDCGCQPPTNSPFAALKGLYKHDAD